MATMRSKWRSTHQVIDREHKLVGCVSGKSGGMYDFEKKDFANVGFIALNRSTKKDIKIVLFQLR